MFAQIKKAGFDGIELNVDAEGNSAHSLTLETTDAKLSEINKISQDCGLPVVSISTSLWWSSNMGSATAEYRASAKKLLEKQLSCAKALGASGILTVPGGISPEISIATAYKNCFDFLAASKETIESYKIYVGLENVWNTFFLSPFDMASFIDRLDCPYVSAYYDVGNTVAFSWSEYWIEILGKRISHIHVKDFKRGSKDFGGVNSGGTWPGLLEGDTNYKKIIPELRKIGWDGYLTAEVGKPDNLTFEQFYKSVAEAEETIIKM